MKISSVCFWVPQTLLRAIDFELVIATRVLQPSMMLLQMGLHMAQNMFSERDIPDPRC